MMKGNLEPPAVYCKGLGFRGLDLGFRDRRIKWDRDQRVKWDGKWNVKWKPAK